MPGHSQPSESNPNEPTFALLGLKNGVGSISLVSGTGKQIDPIIDRTVFVNTATAGSATVALSTDNVTYTTIQTVTTRTTDCLVCPVPKGYFLKVTLTTSTISGTPTYV